MKIAEALCVVSIVLMTPPAQAADAKADEAAIRAAAQSEHAKSTEDAIFWSGAYKRPFILPQKGELFPEDDFGTRNNMKTTVDVQRVEVAASGDLAYEFSLGSLEYDQAGTPPKHLAFKVGLLRVWKKANGEWKIAATFARPLDIPFEKDTAATAK
jgi:ketosteroid isomerase-like protein